jgi:hypothetical protein
MPTPLYTRAKDFILIGFFAVAAMVPAYFNGIPAGNDQSQHFQFADTISRSASSGIVYPPFGAASNHGFGDYGIRFYPPLTYYLMTALFFLTNDWYFASLLLFSLVFLVGAIGVYLWAGQWLESQIAVLAAFFYTVEPYHLNELYNNALLAEFVATAILPFCFLFTARVCRDAKWIDVVGLSVSFSLLVLTHLPLTIICSVALAIYSMILLRQAAAMATIPKLFSAGIASVFLTAFYWSRWLPEIDWITHSSPKYFSTIWDYRANFLLIPGHFINFGGDALNLWFADVLLIAALSVTIPAIILFFKRAEIRNRSNVSLVIVLGAAVLMTTPLSSPVWELAGFLQKVQFPWRWMAVISAFAAILAALGISKTFEALRSKKNIPVAVGLCVVLVVFFFTAAFVTRGAAHIPREQLQQQMASITNSESCDCWWPIWAKREAFAQTDLISVPGRIVESSFRLPTKINFTASSGESEKATIAAFYYPRWQATVNNGPAAITPDENGRLTVALPPDETVVELQFVEPAYVSYAAVLSAAAWLVALALVIVLLVKSRRTAN